MNDIIQAELTYVWYSLFAQETKSSTYATYAQAKPNEKKTKA